MMIDGSRYDCRVFHIRLVSRQTCWSWLVWARVFLLRYPICFAHGCSLGLCIAPFGCGLRSCKLYDQYTCTKQP